MSDLSPIDIALANIRSDPDKMAALDANVLTWEEERKLEAGAAQAAEMDILAVCQKHFPNSQRNLAAPDMLASAISHFDLSDRFEMAQLYLEWTVEAVVGNKLLGCAPDLLKIWELLVDNNQFEDNRFEWNDMDNHLFAIRETPPNKKVWCATSQNTRYMFILDVHETLGITDIHIRRYWDAVEAPRDDWDIEDRDKYAELGFEYAVKQADGLRTEYSDNLLENPYVDRPDLQWWKDCDYEPQYGDCRDSGYVMSMNLSRLDYGQRPRVDRAIYHMSDIKCVSLDISCALMILTEEFAPDELEEVAPDTPEVVPEDEVEAPGGVTPTTLEVGTLVEWDDDGNPCYGEVESIGTGNGHCATHYGNLYVCRFSFDAETADEYLEYRNEPDNETYTRNFDDRSLGNELRIVGAPNA